MYRHTKLATSKVHSQPSYDTFNSYRVKWKMRKNSYKKIIKNKMKYKLKAVFPQEQIKSFDIKRI